MKRVSLVAAAPVAVLALAPPLHELADASFAWHMVQHLVLIFIVAPLLAFGLSSREANRRVVNPIVVAILHAIALWAWHLPVLYDAAVENLGLHVLEHLSFVVTAVMFWLVVRTPSLDRLRRAAVVFVIGLQSSALGALLVFAGAPLYRSHLATARLHGLTPLEDQQLAGGIMWVPPGVVYLVVTLGLLGGWMSQAADDTTTAADARSAS